MSAPETAQRIQGPLTTRVIIGPGPVAAAASELRVSARPLPRYYRYIMYLHIFYYTPKSTARSFLLYVFFLSERNIPIIHGCGTETETHLRLRVLIIFISSCRLIIITSSAQANTNTSAMVAMVQRQREVNNKIIDLIIKNVVQRGISNNQMCVMYI